MEISEKTPDEILQAKVKATINLFLEPNMKIEIAVAQTVEELEELINGAGRDKRFIILESVNGDRLNVCLDRIMTWTAAKMTAQQSKILRPGIGDAKILR